MATFTLNPNGPYKPVKDETKRATFDYVGRYRVIARIIEEYFGEKLPSEVLDVGGLGSLLPEILKTKVVILDEDTHAKQEKYDVGDGAKMPFPDNAFKAVVTSDTLEHVVVKDRKNFIRELLRVSEDLVVLCAPFNKPGVADTELLLNKYFKSLTGKGHRWLDEHIEYGLPEERQVDKIIDDLGYSFVRFGQSNLSVWRLLTSVNLLSQELKVPELLETAYDLNQHYSDHIFDLDFGENTYRTVYIISKKRKLNLSTGLGPQEFNLPAGMLSKFIEELIGHQDRLPNLLSLQEELSARAQESGAIRDELTNVYKSKSWKVTRPLRTLMSLIRTKD